jgi:hypothetical protein
MLNVTSITDSLTDFCFLFAISLFLFGYGVRRELTQKDTRKNVRLGEHSATD